MGQIWCVRKDAVSIERREARFRALENVWGSDFRVHGVRDIPGLRGSPDVLVVFADAASRAVRAARLRGRLNVYVPGYGWTDEQKSREVAEVGSGYYDLIMPDEVYWLPEFRSLHSNVHYVDRGYDDAVFRPPEIPLEKEWAVSFVGNTKAFGRQTQLDALRGLLGDKLNVQSGVDHHEYAQIMFKSLMGFNQVGPVGNPVGLNYRVWELAGCGVAQLVNPTADVLRMFHHPDVHDYDHAIFWRNTKELLDKVRYYMDYPDEAERVGWDGYRVAINAHTWTHHAQEFIGYIRNV